MQARIENSNGTIIISLRVIAQIAADTVSHCFGVVGLAARKGADGLATLLKRESAEKGIKVTAGEQGLSIEVFFVAQYGVNLKVVSDSIIENIKYTVENQTGFAVRYIKVHVEGLALD